MTYASLLGLGALLLAAPGTLVLTAECLLAFLPPRRRPQPARRPLLAVLVPAHDEELLLPRALRSVRDQLASADRLLVVAHDCRDATAAVARALGAEVIEPRTSGAVSRGKSDALLAGLAHLEAHDPPEIVAILDADSVMGRGSLDALARAVAFHGGAVQAEYVFRAARGSGARGELSRLSILIKNTVRPRGLHRIGLNCLLTGSGCAFPIAALRGVPQGDGALAEDTQLALDLARRGARVRLVPEARVTSELPLAKEHASQQHRRWEHGHLDLWLRSPALLFEALARRNAGLLVLALEVAVPPLSVLLGLLLLACTCLPAAPAESVAHVGLEASLASLGLLLFALSATACRELGLRGALRAVCGLPAYLRWKLPVLAAFVLDRERSWTRTPRDQETRRRGGATMAARRTAASTGGSRSA